ncbi:MAG TPA: dihydrodipicolinate synthase family protein [Puia sp.]|nr:dihydrodipicolinate synthase family protein [Puia sp.]
MSKKYQGVVVPAITPLNEDLTLDTAAVEKLLTFFRRHGAHPFILGTTGEFPSLPGQVKLDFIRLAGRLKSGADQLYVGISSNCMADALEHARIALGEGADVVVCNLPSYYQLSETQILKYFETLAEKIPGPLMIYNIPSTTHHSIPLPIVDKLSHHPNVVGLKDSERNEERLVTALQMWSTRKDFSHLLGWSARSVFSLLHGGDGLVPSSGNLSPGIYTDMFKAKAAGDIDHLNRLQDLSDQLGNSYQGGGLGSSLGALKALMQKEGLCQSYTMPPL